MRNTHDPSCRRSGFRCRCAGLRFPLSQPWSARFAILTGVVTVNETLWKRFPPRRTIVVRKSSSAALLEMITQAPPLSSRANAVLRRQLSASAALRNSWKLSGDRFWQPKLWLLGELLGTSVPAQDPQLASPNVKWFGKEIGSRC